MFYLSMHLSEAIFINFKRSIPYAIITRGRSIPISSMMIASELLILIPSLIVDLVASYWQRQGLMILRDEFISMKEINHFKKTHSIEVEALKFDSKLDTKKMIQKYKLLFNSKNYSTLIVKLKEEITSFDKNAPYHSMLKHVLESMLRCLQLRSIHLNNAHLQKIRSPEIICNLIIINHLYCLTGSHFIDKLAYPIQKNGTGIIHQDVPHIPPYE